MVFPEVVSAILEGCGLTLKRAQADPAFQVRKDRFLRISETLRRDPALNAAFQAGPLQIGAALSGLSLRALPHAKYGNKRLGHDWESTAETLAWTRYLGDLLIASCIPCLPTRFRPWEQSTVLGELRTFSGSACDLAKMWRKLSPQLKRDGLRLLMETLSPESRALRSTVDDRADQPPERVLPYYFGPWTNAGQGHRANCLAKAMLVAAFARRAGAKKTLMVTPFTCVHRFRERARGKAAEAIIASLSAMDFPWTCSRFDGLTAIARYGTDEEQERSFPHYAVAFEMEANQWMLVDPNFGFVSELPGGWNLSESWRTLRGLRDTLPGLSIFRFANEPNFSEHLGHIKRIEGRLAALLHAGRDKDTREELVTVLAGSGLLDDVLLWDAFAPPKMKSKGDRRRNAVCVLLEMNLWLYESRRAAKKKEPGSETDPTEEFPCMWALQDESSADELLAQISDGQAKDAFLTFVFALATRAIYGVEDEYEDLQLAGRLYPPACQVSLPGTGSSIPVLSHVALSCGDEVGDEVERLLTQHSFDIHRLTFAAGRKYRRLPSNGSTEEFATAILRALPQVPFSAERLLGTFTGHDSVASTGEIV